ncbi:MAG: hypothetical protein KF902_14225 [Phycisphaeraceae bacterium]|nr:hypothetical protein [Phycisphaeraceae bacterium]MCW5768442.1 hypothetical protein [Phycisphaeraceae bacterium]
MPPSSSRRLLRLVALNAALGLVLAALLVIPEPVAAQPSLSGAPASRARGTYTMLAGKPRTGSGSAIYVIDSVNQEAVALRWNDGKSALEGLGYRSFARDSALLPGR